MRYEERSPVLVTPERLYGSLGEAPSEHLKTSSDCLDRLSRTQNANRFSLAAFALRRSNGER